MAVADSKNGVVCPACSCLCDDIQIEVAGDKIVSAKNACPQGAEWFATPISDSQTRCEGRPTPVLVAIERAMKILRSARAPLVCGLDGLTTEAQREAVKIGLSLNAAIDVSFSKERGSILALQSQGKVTATLGEINSRSDLVVFWFCDPATSHPRLIERYCQSASHVVVVNEARNATAESADEFIQVNREDAQSALHAMQMVLDEKKTELAVDLRGLLTRMAASNYGAMFYGSFDGLLSEANTESLYRLVRKLNSKTRFVTLGLTGEGNVLSAENVLAWHCGFPMAVTHQNGVPVYFGVENTAANLLERGQCDAVLVCSTQSLDQLSPIAMGNLKRAKSIVLSSTGQAFAASATVSIPVSRPGLSSAGDWSRMDDVLLPLTDPLKSTRPSALEILRNIRQELV